MFEDAYGVIRNRRSIKDIILWPKEQGQTIIYKTLHIEN